MNSYVFVNGVEKYKFEAKDSEINVAPLWLGDVWKDFSVDDVKKRLGCMEMSLIFQLIMLILMLMMF